VIDIKVLGLPVLLAELNAKAAEVKADTTDAEKAAAEQIARAWVENIVSEGLVDTGRYRDSIGVVEDGGQVFVTTDVPYSRFLEYGTAYIAAHPVAERALEENADSAIDAAAASLRGRL
jgi:HK97 gp10 family phage protein